MADIADRLADWLEELGLAGQLAAAGLPTYQRDCAGRARWIDPRTGGPLDDQQLGDLDRMLHSDGDEPGHAVPIALVQLRRRATVRATLLASEVHSYASLGALRARSENATRFAVHKAAERGGILLVQNEGRTLIPAFQLTDDGEVRPELGAVLEPLLSVGADPWNVWSWLTHPAALLGGQVPSEAVRDPEEAPLVRHAAVLLAERSRAEQE